MAPSADRVNTKRAYDSSRRQERARETRERIVRVAQRRFLTEGYAATSVAAIAETAGVSVDTIYKTFGGKAGLVRAIHERALQGEGPVPAEQRSDRLQAQERDPRKIIAGWGRFVAEIAPRGAPFLLLLRNAAVSDPALRTLLDDIDAARLRRMSANARRLHEAGHLRPGISVPAAADILWTYSSVELYELLVVRRGMPLERYARFVTDAMTAALL